MNQRELRHERQVAEVQGDVRLERGLNWVMISFAIIILTIIIGGIAFTLLPDNFFNWMNSPSNSPGAPVNNR